MSSTSSLSASIIICTCNRASNLQQTLDSIERLEIPEGHPCELVVVDNASTDETAQVVQNYPLSCMPLRYVHEAHRGKGHAYNTGIKAAKGEILVFTDDDVRPASNWLRQHVACYEDSTIAAVQGAVKVAYESPPPAWFDPQHHGEIAAVDHGAERIVPYTQHLVGANMSFRKDVVRAIGNFNPLLGPGQAGLMDDTDFSIRLLKAGFIQCYEPMAVVTHMIPGSRLTPASFRRMCFNLGVSAFIADNFGSSQSFWRHVAQFLRHSLRMLKTEIKYWMRRQRPVCPQSELFYWMDLGWMWARLQGKRRLIKRFSS